MKVIITCICAASAIKLQQHPDLDKELEFCSDGHNFHCWKKGGESLDKEFRAKFNLKPRGIESITFTFTDIGVSATCADAGGAGTPKTMTATMIMTTENTGDTVCINNPTYGVVTQEELDTAVEKTCVPTDHGYGCPAALASSAGVASYTNFNDAGSAADVKASKCSVVFAFVMQTAAQSDGAATTGGAYAMWIRGAGLHRGGTAVSAGTTATDTAPCYQLSCAVAPCNNPAIAGVGLSATFWCNSAVLTIRTWTTAVCGSTAKNSAMGAGSGTPTYYAGHKYYLSPDFTLPTCR